MADKRIRRIGVCTDARGTEVTLLDPYVMHKTRQHNIIPADTLESIARKVGIGWARAGQIIFSIIWPAVIVCMVIAHFGKWGGGLTVHPRELRLWLVLLGIFIVNVIIVWILSRAGRLSKVRKVMLEHLRCPHCGYDIRGLPRSPDDGATVCPECGSAWPLDHRQQPATSSP